MNRLNTKNKKEAIRLAVLALLQRYNHIITTRYIVDRFGVSPRTAQRDLQDLPVIQAKTAEELDRLDNPEPVEKTYTVKQVSELLGLNPYHVRLLARSMKVGERKRGGWRFTEEDIEILRDRPGKRK